MMDSYQYMQNRRSYRELNSYVPNPRSYRTTGTYIPNQQPASTPANIYESRGSGTDPTITAGNTLGQFATYSIAAIEDIQGQIERVKVSTDTWLKQDIGGNATTDRFVSNITIEWKSKEAEAAFNTLQADYNAQVDKIKSEQRVIPLPGPNATKEELAKYANAVTEATLGTQFRIGLLGPSPMQQLLNNATNSKDFIKEETQVRVIPEIRQGQ